MAIYALVIEDRIVQIFTTAPVVHEDLEIADVTSYDGAAVGWYRQGDSTFGPTAPVEALTADLRQYYLDRIDAGAERARTAFTTPGDGQGFTYQQKQAEAVKRTGGSPPADSQANYPYLYASIGNEINPNTGVYYTTIAQVGAQVLLLMTQQTTAYTAIEALRLAGKSGVRAATTTAQAVTAATITWPTPSS